MDILCPSWHPWEELPEAVMSDHQMNVTVVKAARAYRFTLQWLISGADDWPMWRQLSCGDNGRIINLVPWWGCRERRCTRVCFCAYVGLFDEVKAALVCLPGADEALSRKGRLCLLLSHTNRQHTHWLCPWRVTLTCTEVRAHTSPLSESKMALLRIYPPVVHPSLISSTAGLAVSYSLFFLNLLTNSPPLTFLIH